LFFVANDGIHGAEIWISEGSPVTTNELLDLGPGSAGSNPTALKDADGNLMFIADDGIHGAEPWVYALTSGVAMVLDICPGATGSSPAGFTVSCPHVFFTADDGVHGQELWTMDCLSTTAVPGGHPETFALSRNRPNPFSRATRIDFDLPRAARVSLRLYDVSGRLVRTLADGTLPAGRHSLEWNGTTDDGLLAPDGVYFCRMEAEGFRSHRRMVLLR
jgi:ELWxxDGT repeat protein